MKKYLYLGSTFDGKVFVTVTTKETDGKTILSISGVIGPKANGDAAGCGQINMSLKPSDFTKYSNVWNIERITELLNIWDRWHLNNMRPGCKHQAELWDTSENLTLTNYTWSDKFHAARKYAVDGTMSADEYIQFSDIIPLVQSVTTAINRPKYATDTVKYLLEGGWIKADKQETKAAGWVNEHEHPEGKLSKACPVCGYKYGTAWLFEELPDEIKAYIAALPDDETLGLLPACWR